MFCGGFIYFVYNLKFTILSAESVKSAGNLNNSINGSNLKFKIDEKECGSHCGR